MIGLVHPGSMGAAVGQVLLDRGHEVGWASAGRSDATRARAAGFTDVAIRATARELGVEDELLTEWALSLPGLPRKSEQAARTGAERGWRWAYELEEVGRTFAAAGQPDGFGAAAAEVFRRLSADG